MLASLAAARRALVPLLLVLAGCGRPPAPNASRSCDAVVCASPPANRCSDADHLVSAATNGVCDDGSCSYASHTITCAGGCRDGQCLGDPCLGKSCVTPGPATCDDATHLRTPEPSGVCSSDGTCHYLATITACPMGCANGRCQDSPCAGVTCTTPEANRCEDASHLRVFDARGTCSGAAGCQYTSMLIECPSGCDGGRCKDNPCAGVTCNMPDANHCENPTQLRVFEHDGTCLSDGHCDYGSHLQDCANGCENGRCKDNPCAGVICTTPSANSCEDAMTLRVYDTDGTCAADGHCVYTSKLQPCQFGCDGGHCKMDPCAGVTCDTPSANSCEDATHLRVWDHDGTCRADGSCAYTSKLLPCDFGCDAGQCKQNPCLGVTCSQPPAAFCEDASHRRVYADMGTCRGNRVCSYDSMLEACAFGCDAGRCKSGPVKLSLATVTLHGQVTRNEAFSLKATLLDDAGNPVAAPATVTLAVAPAGSLSGPTSADTVGAVATFAGLVFADAGRFTFTASAPNLPPATLIVDVTNWEFRGGRPGNSVPPFVVDPADPNTVYAFHGGAGVRRSIDGGATWSLLLDGGFGALAIDPRDSRVLYLCASDGSLWKSIDGGQTHTTHQPGGCLGITIDPSSSSTIYVTASSLSNGVDQARIYRSTDGGETWPTKLTPPPGTLAPPTVVVDPTQPQKLFVSYSKTSEDVPVESSIDGGLTWKLAFNMTVDATYAVAVDPSQPSTVMACSHNCYRSTDGGINFFNVAGPGPIYISGGVAADPAVPGSLYVYSQTPISTAASLGIWQSTDHGATFVRNGPFPKFSTYAGYAPSHPATVYAITGTGVWRTTTGGR